LSRSGVRVVDLTTVLGGQAVSQIGVALSHHERLQTIALSRSPGAPTFEWMRTPLRHEDWQGNAPGAAIFLLGPGSVQSAKDALRWATEAGTPCIRLFTMPNAIIEELTLRPLIPPGSPTTHLYRLPDSSPDTLWFVLTEEFNKLASLYGIDSLQPAEMDQSKMSANLKQSMEAAMTIDGAMAAALVDYRSGMCMAQAGGGMNLDLAAAGNTQVVRAKMQTMESLGLRRGIEDILITLHDQYHLIRLMPNNPGLFLYLVLDKAKGNLALARYKLTEIERSLKV
jgi:hypothetical protein